MKIAPDNQAVPVRPTINVAAGVLIDHHRLLITQRNSGFWEFPGGKLERGETPRQALKRELMEELGVAVRVGEELMKVDHADETRRIILHTFFCSLAEGRPRAVDVADLAWIRLEELPGFEFMEADKQIAAELGRHPALLG